MFDSKNEVLTLYFFAFFTLRNILLLRILLAIKRIDILISFV